MRKIRLIGAAVSAVMILTSVAQAEVSQAYNLSGDQLAVSRGKIQQDSAKQGWIFGKVLGRQQVTGTVTELPKNCGGVKVSVELSFPKNARGATVWGCVIEQKSATADTKSKANAVYTPAVRVAVPVEGDEVVAQLDSYCPINPTLPVTVAVERFIKDQGDNCDQAVVLKRIIVTALPSPPPPMVIEDAPGYNAWPIIQNRNGQLICTYSRGKSHSVTEPERNAYVRTSEDNGATWSEEILLSNSPTECEGCCCGGPDEKTDTLLWLQSSSRKKTRFTLLSTSDGKNYERICEPKFSPHPRQIMNIINIPGKGLFCLWFAGSYKQDDGSQCWGTLFSADNGKTWTQQTVESNITRDEWPTEPGIVYLGNGKILGIGRHEGHKTGSMHAQFQLQSEDYGVTWTKRLTNITDIHASTASLILDKDTGLLSCYYFYRGRGILNRRVVKAAEIWNNPLAWSEPETVALGKKRISDSGNVNAVATNNGKHALAYYLGNKTQTDVVVSVIPAPTEAPKK